jgi:hypothetical protein
MVGPVPETSRRCPVERQTKNPATIAMRTMTITAAIGLTDCFMEELLLSAIDSSPV